MPGAESENVDPAHNSPPRSASSLPSIPVAASSSESASPSSSSPSSLPPLSLTYPPLSAAAQAAGRCTIVGFGSLLSERSARSTFPLLTDFRPGMIDGYRRIFAHVAPIFIERNIAKLETKEMSSLSVEPSPGTKLCVSVFEIPLSELPAFYSRELEFRWMFVPVLNADGDAIDPKAINGEGMICAAYASDEELRRERLGYGEEIWKHLFGRWGVQQVWRNDILPCPTYMRHVVLAAAGMDERLREMKRLDGEAMNDTVDRIEWGEQPVNDRNGSTAQSTTVAVTSSEGTDGSASSTPASSQSQLHSSSSSSRIVTADYISLPVGPFMRCVLHRTFLADRTTTLGDYITRIKPNIMIEARPPPSLEQRYSG